MKPLLRIFLTTAVFFAPLGGAHALTGKSYSGTIHLRPLGVRKANLHIRDGGISLEGPGLFGVLAIADAGGSFGSGLVYRFPRVQIDAEAGRVRFRLERTATTGQGTALYTIDARFDDRVLEGEFLSNQVSPDGQLVEGPLRLRISG